LGHKQQRLRQHGRDQKQELANSQLASILKNIEGRLSNMHIQVPASSMVGSIRRRSKQLSTGSNTMTFSGEAFQSSGATHQPDAAPFFCDHYSTFSQESARVGEHVGHPAPVGTTDRQYQEDANAQVRHGHSQMQLMLAKASKCLEKVVPLNECHLSDECSAAVEESDRSQTPTN